MNRSHIGVQSAAVHAFGWLFLANLVGLWLALLLVVPEMGGMLGEFSYGRWVPLHLNLQLYGWCSLPLVGLLVHAFGGDGRFARVCIWLWSAALLLGAEEWLDGITSGKIFLDWKGASLAMLVIAMLALWIYIARATWIRFQTKLCGVWWRLLIVLFLLPVPLVMIHAADPTVYPPVNPDSGGPTGASLLGSSLSIIILLLLLPATADWQGGKRKRLWTKLGWGMFLLHCVLFGMMKHGNASNRDWGQYTGLGLLLLWIPLMPIYLKQWKWHQGITSWVNASCAWLGVLILTGWMSFLPKLLDEMKFTDSLVAHSHLAMAGFVTSFLMVVLGQILPEDKLGNLGKPLLFQIWNIAVFIYISLMWYAGWVEAHDVDFVMGGTSEARLVYLVRLGCGVAMLGVSWCWWRDQLRMSNDS